MERVRMVQGDGVDSGEPEMVWLQMEWEYGESAHTKHHVLWFRDQSCRRLTHKEAVRIVKQRWRTERAYEDLKGELGLDHFEGRRFRGWHHHVSVALTCFAFIVAERARASPLGRKRRSDWSAAESVRNGTSRIPSSQHASRLPICSPDGFRAAPSAIISAIQTLSRKPDHLVFMLANPAQPKSGDTVVLSSPQPAVPI
jgi:hypothetical protein